MTTFMQKQCGKRLAATLRECESEGFYPPCFTKAEMAQGGNGLSLQCCLLIAPDHTAYSTVPQSQIPENSTHVRIKSILLPM